MKILYILHGLNVGGAEVFLRNLSTCFLGKNVQMDFLLRYSSNNSSALSSFFEKFGSAINIVPSFSLHFVKNSSKIIRYINKNIWKYDVIHIHTNSHFYYFSTSFCKKI